jgi:methyl-accepting chemotaxis protein
VSPFAEWKEGMKPWFSLMSILAGLMVGGFSFFLVKAMLLRKISMVGEQLRVLSEGQGHVSRRISFSSDDELGELSTHFNGLLEKLQESFDRVKEVAEEISSHSASTREMSHALSEGGTTKTKLIVDTAVSIDGLKHNFQMIVENLRDLRTSSDESRGAAQGQVLLIEKINEQVALLLRQCQSNSASVEVAVSAERCPHRIRREHDGDGPDRQGDRPQFEGNIIYFRARLPRRRCRERSHLEDAEGDGQDQ